MEIFKHGLKNYQIYNKAHQQHFLTVKLNLDKPEDFVDISVLPHCYHGAAWAQWNSRLSLRVGLVINKGGCLSDMSLVLLGVLPVKGKFVLTIVTC